MKFRVALVSLFVVLSFAVAVHGGVEDPVEGDAFHALIAAQDVDLRLALGDLHLDGLGCLVTGPLDPFFEGDDDTVGRMLTPRVVCPNMDVLAQASRRIAESGLFSKVKSREYIEKGADGFRGIEIELRLHGNKHRLLLMTLQQTRWLIWVRDVWACGVVDVEDASFRRYAAAVSDYLYRVDVEPRPVDNAISADRVQSDEGEGPAAPLAVDYGLPEPADFFAPPPAYVIDGFQNFMDFLHAHDELRTPFARAITAFVPGDSLRESMITHPPEVAWPNKGYALIQHEYRKFFERGGDIGVIRTLTADQLQTLVPGEYCYCVGMSGDIRFTYEVPFEEAEMEEGKKMARPNHAFLFPGEPVLAAGAFFVETHGEEKRIGRVNAESGHYFYSNVTATIREDVTVRSDEYLMTLGHFLAALERLGIETEGILISKM